MKKRGKELLAVSIGAALTALLVKGAEKTVEIVADLTRRRLRLLEETHDYEDEEMGGNSGCDCGCGGHGAFRLWRSYERTSEHTGAHTGRPVAVDTGERGGKEPSSAIPVSQPDHYQPDRRYYRTYGGHTIK